MDFLPDIEQFVRLRFRPEKYADVTKLLQSPAVSTPRVMRCVLYLSNGSLTMLEHYISETEKDVRQTLIDAEYNTEVSETPIFLRDMSLPFPEVGNLGPKACGRKPAQLIRENSTEHRMHHRELVGRGFVLGSAAYSILPDQPSRALVCCERRTAAMTHSVRLPLVFVLEQLAETVDMTQAGFTAS